MTTNYIYENKYLYWESVHEINRTLFRVDNGKKIEDLELNLDGGIEPNVIICFSGRNRVEIDFNNIYSSVRTIITNKENVIGDKYLEIPEYIENIVVDHRIYKNTRSRIEFIELMDEKEIKNLIKELVESGNINLKNSFNENLLMICLKYKIYEYINYLIDNMEDEIKYIETKHKRNILYWACYSRMKEKALKIIREGEEDKVKKLVDTIDIFNLTALDWACMIGEYELAYEIVIRMDKEIINKIINIELKKRVIIGESCLHYAKLFKMEKVVEILESVKEEYRVKEEKESSI